MWGTGCLLSEKKKKTDSWVDLATCSRHPTKFSIRIDPNSKFSTSVVDPASPNL
eukprot:SAG31_NODE_22865_length_516_cov_1.013008_1_plen_53_part_10